MNVNDPTKESLIFLLSSKEEGSRALGPLRMGFSALNESSVTNPSSTVPSAFLEPNEGCYLVLTLAWKIKWSYNLQRSIRYSDLSLFVIIAVFLSISLWCSCPLVFFIA